MKEKLYSTFEEAEAAALAQLTEHPVNPARFTNSEPPERPVDTPKVDELMQDGTTKAEAEREVLIAALAAGNSHTVSGRAANVSERTVRRRMADPEFATQVADRRRLHVLDVSGALLASGLEAVEVVRDCLTSDKPSDRLRAAELLLTTVRRMFVEDLQVQVAQYEADKQARNESTGMKS